ncbi:MAG TPA: MFS transporter [Candidatus Hydrogenedentes bacterium]|nr:MFS transporter [Candidatus Hydrogenedentota bacterium]
MRLPIVSVVHELAPPGRRFLYFNFFNVISWQCVVGPAMILFARKIGMPASWVGFLISFMPLTMILVLFTVPLVNRLGPKNVMMKGWLSRNLIMSTVFLMPLAVRFWGPRAGWYVLTGATLGFCIVRAVAVGGWFPWLHEVLSEGERGAFFSAEATIVQAVNVALILAQGLVLSGDPGMGRFLSIYAAGILAGLLSLYYMSRIPGGGPLETDDHEEKGWRAYGLVLHNRHYIAFILTGVFCFSSLSWFGSALVLYMRDALELPSRTIMTVMAAGSAGIFFTIRFWGRFADHSGSSIAMALSMVGHAIAALGFLLLDPEAAWTPYLLAPAVCLVSLFNAACWMAGHRAMLNFVRERGRVAYTNIWTISTSMALGFTPILVGFVIDRWHLDGFRFCFLFAGLAGLVGAVACRLFVSDGPPFTRPLRDLLNPGLPVRTLARIAWITAGLHISNRERGM